MKKVIFPLLALLLSRCASMEKSIGLGVGIGAATGITASGLANYNTKGTLVLGLSGAILGGVIGALLHKPTPEAPKPVPMTPVLKMIRPH